MGNDQDYEAGSEIPQLGLMLPAYKEASTGYIGCQLEGLQGMETKVLVQKMLVAGVSNLKDIIEFVGAADLRDLQDRFAAVEPDWTGIDAAKAYRMGILINKAIGIMVDLGISPGDWVNAQRLADEASTDLETAGEMNDIRERHDKCHCISCRILKGETLDLHAFDDEADPDF